MSFSIETIKEYSGRGFKCALFDFDGTLISLIREGWQKVMIPYSAKSSKLSAQMKIKTEYAKRSRNSSTD